MLSLLSPQEAVVLPLSGGLHSIKAVRMWSEKAEHFWAFLEQCSYVGYSVG